MISSAYSLTILLCLLLITLVASFLLMLLTISLFVKNTTIGLQNQDAKAYMFILQIYFFKLFSNIYFQRSSNYFFLINSLYKIQI